MAYSSYNIAFQQKAPRDASVGLRPGKARLVSFGAGDVAENDQDDSIFGSADRIQRRRTQDRKTADPSPRPPVRLPPTPPRTPESPRKDAQVAPEPPPKPSQEQHTKPPKTEEEEPGETPWEDYDIPTELEIIQSEIPEEICNIIQESLDEHRAVRASRLHAQAIVVTTHITQSRTSLEDAKERGQARATVETSAETSHRRTESRPSTTDDSVDVDLVRKPGEVPLYPFPSGGSQSSPSGKSRRKSRSQESLNQAESSGITKILKGRTIFSDLLRGKRAKDDSLLNQEPRIVDCTSCFDEVPRKKAINLPCRHEYCSGCFAQLIVTAMQQEETFPPRCCLQEIPRKTIRGVLSTKQLADFELKALEYAVAVTNRYYCPSPTCGQWIDTRKARRLGGALECPHCRKTMCAHCRSPEHGHGQDCPQDFGLDATLKQAERAGWQRCPNCRALVELRTGCRHITCKCKAEFW